MERCHRFLLCFVTHVSVSVCVTNVKALLILNPLLLTSFSVGNAGREANEHLERTYWQSERMLDNLASEVVGLMAPIAP